MFALHTADLLQLVRDHGLQPQAYTDDTEILLDTQAYTDDTEILLDTHAYMMTLRSSLTHRHTLMTLRSSSTHRHTLMTLRPSSTCPVISRSCREIATFSPVIKTPDMSMIFCQMPALTTATVSGQSPSVVHHVDNCMMYVAHCFVLQHKLMVLLCVSLSQVFCWLSQHWSQV